MSQLDEPSWIDGLRSPSAFPHAVESVQIVETHISWVVLTGQFAYKVKKPLDLGFLDFSTLERRRHFCWEELRLNRRTAPEVYLDVVPIVGPREAPRVAAEGEPIEFAIQMRQFPASALMATALQEQRLTATHIDQLAAAVAQFHGQIEIAPPSSAFGTPAQVWRPLEENFEQLDLPGEAGERIAALKAWARAEFAAQQEAFLARKAKGFIRECHGDLHLGNMLLLDGESGGEIVIFDCIEFNEAYRWIDVLSDIAFAVMDLADRGRPDFAQRLLNGYLERTGDYLGLAVLRFYLVHRAIVRAKIAHIRHGQLTDPAAQAQAAEEREGYLRLAEEYTQPPRPLLFLTHGPSGSGKTSVTQPLLESLGAVRLRSDIERKRLFGFAALAQTKAAPGSGIYTPQATEQTYARLAEFAECALRAGNSTIVDATFLKRAPRAYFQALADRLRVPLAILDFDLPDGVLRERIERRIRAGGDASEADLDVLDQQLAGREPLTPEEQSRAIRGAEPDGNTPAELLQRIDHFRSGNGDA